MAGQWPQNGRDQVRLDCSQGTQKSPGLVRRSVFSLSLQLQHSLFSFLLSLDSFQLLLLLFSFSFLPILSLSPSFSLFYIPLCYSLLPCMLLLHRGLTLFPLFHHSTILSIFFFSVFFSLDFFLFSLSSFLLFSSLFLSWPARIPALVELFP